MEPPAPPESAPPPNTRLTLRRRPYTCGSILAACVAVYLWEVVFPGSGSEAVDHLALYGPLTLHEPWRVLTYAVVHGGPIHLLFNAMGVYNLGIPLERAVGSLRFALLSLVTCVGAAAFALRFNFDQATVGVSGVILGWLGAALFLVNRQGRRSLLLGLAQVAAISLLPHVSWAAHLGGAVFGLPLGWAMRKSSAAFRVAVPLALFIAAVFATLAAAGVGLGG